MSNFSILIFLVSFLAISGCTEENKVQLPELIAGNEIIAVPEFNIEIALTDEARQKLRQSGESIKGAIHFDGDGASLKEVKTAPFRDVYLGKYDFELKTEGSLHIEDASISHEAYSRLKDENYHYFVNAYSGRRVYNDNILDCEVVYGRFQSLKSGNIIHVACKLL